MAPSKVILSIPGLYVTSTDTLKTNSFIKYGEHQRRHISPYSSPQDFNSNPNRLLPTHPNIASPQSSHQSQPTPDPKASVMDSLSPPPPPGKGKHALSSTIDPDPKRSKLEAKLDQYDQPQKLLKNENSPLFDSQTPLKSILTHPLAVCTLATLPGDNQIAGVDSDGFATAAAAFKEDGRDGRHDAEWVAQATIATQKRKDGDFQGYEEARFEAYWATQQRQLSDKDEGKARKARKVSKAPHDNVDKFKVHKREDSDEEGRGGAGGIGGNNSGLGSTFTAAGNGYSKSNTKDARTDSSNGAKNHSSSKDMANIESHDLYQIHTAPVKLFDRTPTYGSPPIVPGTLYYPTSRAVLSEQGRLDLKGCSFTIPIAGLRYPSAFRNTGPVYTTANDQPAPTVNDMTQNLKSRMHRGQNVGERQVAYLNATIAFYENADAPETQFEDWPGRGYCDNPKSVYPDFIYVAGKGIEIIPRRGA